MTSTSLNRPHGEIPDDDDRYFDGWVDFLSECVISQCPRSVVCKKCCKKFGANRATPLVVVPPTSAQ